jgi:hypothetical protein
MHTWAICKVVVKTMFPFVKQCILNQTRGYWLLSNALNVALSINVCMQNQIQQSKITPFNFVKGDFEYELGALRVCMMVEVLAILALFLAFASTYNANKVHNMLALMLDPRFKSFDVVKAFVGQEKMILMVVEYDNKTLLPLLVVTFQFLNPNFDGLIEATQIDGDEDSIFGAVNTLHELLINEINLFCHLHVKPKDSMPLLTWWKIHEARIFCGSIDFGDSWVPYQN